jgi:hypothetical protein
MQAKFVSFCVEVIHLFGLPTFSLIACNCANAIKRGGAMVVDKVYLSCAGNTFERYYSTEPS